MQDHAQADPGLKLPWNWPQDALPTPTTPTPSSAVSRLLSTSSSRSTKPQTAGKLMLRKP